MKIIYKNELESLIDVPAILEAIEEGFIIFSKKEAIIPPVASIHFDNPPGDCHIKYGYAMKNDYYVIKIASSFYNNSQVGMPTGNGMMLLFDKNTGQPVCSIFDEGLLTDHRTAAAGCLAAKYLAPKNLSCIGIVGTGAQAVFQLQYLRYATTCKNVFVWSRDRLKAQKFCENPSLSAFKMHTAENLQQLTADCNLIVTTTSSSTPLFFADQIQKGTHINAIGADDFDKQEIDPNIFAKADRIVVDSREQCKLFGDASYALKEGLIKENQLIEMGEMILTPTLRRTSDEQITIADLTGIAIQDLQIATEIMKKIK